jgi:hypothetical protein
MRRKRTRKASKDALKGSNLHLDSATGKYVWRATREDNGKRVLRRTGTANLARAFAKAAEFEDDLEREYAGRDRLDRYKEPLLDHLNEFLGELGCRKQRLDTLEMHLRRAFQELRLSRVADLAKFSTIKKKLKGLKGFSNSQKRRTFQEPLKQFSKWLAANEVVEFDHLAAWTYPKDDNMTQALDQCSPTQATRKRRALDPDEFVRALAASEFLDQVAGRKYPTRMRWVTLLVAGPRIGALAELDLTGFDRAAARLRILGNDRKRAGAATLDPATASELEEYVGDRISGPLLLSPRGSRIERRNSVRAWQDCVSLALIDMLWPDDVERDLDIAYFVHLSLRRGGIRSSRGGPKTGKHAPKGAKLEEQSDRQQRILNVFEAIQEEWQKKMQGVDQHCLRKTHRTWATAMGVSEILVDRQLGHASKSDDERRQDAWSEIGRRHYTDMTFLTLNARESAIAVRKLLDRAQEAFIKDARAGKSCFRCDGKDDALSAGA